jgi:hypothetical protein
MIKRVFRTLVNGCEKPLIRRMPASDLVKAQREVYSEGSQEAWAASLVKDDHLVLEAPQEMKLAR